MKQHELFEQIEAYLEQRMSPEALQAWEQRLANDPKLRQELELHRQLQQDYDKGRLELRSNLHDIMNEAAPVSPETAAKGKFRWWPWLGLLAVLIITGWIIWPRETPAPIPPKTPSNYVPETPVKDEPIKDEPVAPKASPSKPARPMATTDPGRFTPNPGMEAFVASGMRSESLEVSMSRPSNGLQFIPDATGIISIRFSGTCSWTDEASNPGFVLSFFDNKNSNKALRTEAIVPKLESANKLDFDMTLQLKFEPGLYYFSVEAVDQGEILYAGKFLVGN